MTGHKPITIPIFILTWNIKYEITQYAYTRPNVVLCRSAICINLKINAKKIAMTAT